jgi:integrase
MAAIEKRGECSFRLTVSCGYDSKGKQIRKFKTVDLSHIPAKKREEEAQKQWLLFKDEIEKGLFLDGGKISFGEFTEKWIKEYAEPALAPKTLYEYRHFLDQRILPALGHIKLIKLQPTHLTEFYNNLREVGIRNDNKPGALSEKTILHYHRLISSILTTAVQWQFILSNVAERVKPPRSEKKEARHFNEEQVRYILDLLENEPIKYKAMIYLSIFCGLRMGELAGLEWSDVDTKNSYLRIRQSSQYLPGKGVFTKNTKTMGSQRTISLPGSVISILNEYKLWQNGQKAIHGDLWIESDRLLQTIMVV